MTGTDDRGMAPANRLAVLDKLYEGKAKILHRTEDPGVLLVEYKDDATALDGLKKGSIEKKGWYNAEISAFFFRYLASRGAKSHFIASAGERRHLVRAVEILPIEVVVRNVAAGSLSRRLGLEEGLELPFPLVEFYYKNDFLHDPFITRGHALALGLANEDDLDELERQALQINKLLKEVLTIAGIRLVDFKLEFGRRDGGIVLADEISPDTCRFWDAGSGARLDKDRFRRDMGDEAWAYAEVYRRLSALNVSDSDDALATGSAAADSQGGAAWRTTWQAAVEVRLKPGVLDPQGVAVSGALRANGFDGLDGVRVGKLIEVALTAASRAEAEVTLKEMCRRLLANPVIETYRFTLSSTSSSASTSPSASAGLSSGSASGVISGEGAPA